MDEQELPGKDRAPARKPPDRDIDHGVQISGLYDGVCYWVLKDGTAVNRFPADHYAYKRTEKVVEAFNLGHWDHVAELSS
jgi:hypothetical protein